MGKQCLDFLSVCVCCATGGEQALTLLGNLVLRVTFNQEHAGDPVQLVGTTDKNFMMDIRYM